MLRTVTATGYVTPLREGGSLPGLVEADDDGMYVVKFRGAGQGTAALVAEVVVGELGRRIGVGVPDLVAVELDPAIGLREPDQEVQELLKVSPGLNLGMDFLPGSVGYDGVAWRPDPLDAARVYWLDAFTANIDRTWRNPNLLVWHRNLWAIDHGAALVFQHAWPTAQAWAGRHYDLSQHVLLPVVRSLDAGTLADLDAALAADVVPVLGEVLELVPGEWLKGMNAAQGDPRTPAQWRERYVEQLTVRAGGERGWFSVEAAA